MASTATGERLRVDESGTVSCGRPVHGIALQIAGADGHLVAPGEPGELLIRALESRLDNVVYRLGLAESRKQARQIVTHGLISLNGRKMDIPSAHVKMGDEVAFSAKGGRSEYAKLVQETIRSKQAPGWLSLDMTGMKGRVVGEPTLEQAEAFFDPNVIVEYYSR